MSTLNVSNITDGTDTVGTSYVLNGSAKAWAAIGQIGTMSFKDSFNMTSVTDDGTGRSRCSFTSSLNNSNYAVTSHAEQGGSFNDIRCPNKDDTQARSTSEYAFYICHGNGSPTDATTANVIVQGDLA